MADIYRYEFTDKDGEQWRLDFSEPGSALGGSPTVEVMKHDAIRGITSSWEWDKWPVGLATPTRFEFVFTVASLPTALRDELLQVPSLLTLTLNSTLPGADQVDVTVRCRVCVALYRWTGGTWNMRWMGTQDVGATVSPELSESGAGDTLTVEMVDAWQEAAKGLTLPDVRDADFKNVKYNTTYTSRQGVASVLFTEGGVWKGVLNGVWGVALWGVLRNTLYTLWQTHLADAMTLIMRRTVTLDMVTALEAQRLLPRQQRYVKNEPWPSAMLILQPSLIPFLVDGTSLTYSMHDELARNYPSMYDLLVDMLGEGARSSAVYYDGAANCYVASWQTMTRAVSPTVVDIAPRARNTKVTLNDRVMTAAIASSELRQSADYDRIEQTLQAGRNDEGLTVPIVTTTSPSALEAKGGTAVRFVAAQMTMPASAHDHMIGNFYPDLLGLYYLSTAGGAFSTSQFIRCASWWPGDGSTAPTAATYEWTNEPHKWAGSALADQQETGVMYQIATYLYTTFGTTPGSTLACTLRANEIPDMRLSAYTMHTHEMQMDLTTTRAWLSSAPTTWIATKVDCDWISGLVNVEAYGQ